MTNELESGPHPPDPAAVFACALSLREACLKRAEADPEFNLSTSFHGRDEFMREMMRIGNLFEAWACAHVAFDQNNEVWPYLMEEKFGDACLGFMHATTAAQFDERDCLRVALRLRLPIHADDRLPVPVDVCAPNPVGESEFRQFRIQTVRNDLDDGEAVPFTADDDPFDDEFGPPYFALYGVGKDGTLEHIANRRTYCDALALAQKLAPGVPLPLKPRCFATDLETSVRAPVRHSLPPPARGR